jgi:hypothetical protein
VESQEPSEETINNHAERAYSFVRDTLQWAIDRILIYGYSLGSGPACYIASTKLVGGLMLQSAFTSLQNLIEEKIGILFMLINNPGFDNLQAMNRIQCPTLVIHVLIPFHRS